MDMMCAVAIDRDRKHEETRKSLQVKKKELIDRVLSESAQLVEDERRPGRSICSTPSTQWRWNSPASCEQTCTARCAQRSQSAPKRQEDGAEKESVHPVKVNQVTKQVKTLWIQCAEEEPDHPRKVNEGSTRFPQTQYKLTRPLRCQVR